MKNLVQLTALGLLITGCAGISFRTAAVTFENPIEKLNVIFTEPTPGENAGVLLRINPPEDGIRKYREETRIFAGIKENVGKEVRLDRERTETFKPGSRPDTYILNATTIVNQRPDAIVEEAEISTRDEIIRFISGRQDAKDGKFSITDWTRTPVYPEAHVKIGDSWEYTESMSLKIDSFFLKQEDASPYHLAAKSQLTGFAEVKGVRCAVIDSEAREIQTQRLKILWKKMTLYIQVQLKETVFLDYEKGRVMGRIMKAETFTNSADGKVSGHSMSQTVAYPL